MKRIFSFGHHSTSTDRMISIVASLSLILAVVAAPVAVEFCTLSFVCQSERKWNVCDHYWLDYYCHRRDLTSTTSSVDERGLVFAVDQGSAL